MTVCCICRKPCAGKCYTEEIQITRSIFHPIHVKCGTENGRKLFDEAAVEKRLRRPTWNMRCPHPGEDP